MTFDYTTESAIGELRQLADDVDRETRALTAELDRVGEELAEQRFTASAPNGAVSATVTGAGKLVGITISGVDRRRPRTERLSADLTAAVLAARSAAATEMGARMKTVVPGFFED
jgi:DNA-binding protein YbaB